MINFKRYLAASAIAASAFALPVTLAGSPAGATVTEATAPSVQTDVGPCIRQHRGREAGRPCRPPGHKPDAPRTPDCALPEHQDHSSDPCNPGPIDNGPNRPAPGSIEQVPDCARPEHQDHSSDPCNPGPTSN